LKTKLFYVKVLLCVISLFGIKKGNAQEDFSWWNRQQNWDGVTHWSSYMILSPYYMGPNALNVPFSEKGRVDEQTSFRLYSDVWFSSGDHTRDVGVHLYLPVVSKVIALEVWGVGWESYAMTSALAAKRRVRHEQASGSASGDAYFATVVSLLRDRKFPDLALRIALRTASGGKLCDARYTDAPGYFFDLSAGKNIPIGHKNENYLRGFAMFGFYVWQMNPALYRQDDAILFGSGVDIHLDKSILSMSMAGYWGYLGNSKLIIINPLQPIPYYDRPVVWRMSYAHKWKKWKMTLRLQGGINDFMYTSVQCSMSYSLPNLFRTHN